MAETAEVCEGPVSAGRKSEHNLVSPAWGLVGTALVPGPGWEASTPLFSVAAQQTSTDWGVQRHVISKFCRSEVVRVSSVPSAQGPGLSLTVARGVALVGKECGFVQVVGWVVPLHL